MEIVEIDSSVLVSSEKELLNVLSKLDCSRLEQLAKINFWLNKDWLNIYLSGTSDVLEEFEKVLKEIAPFIEEKEDFFAYFSNDYGTSSTLYVFKDNTFYKYEECCCYPNYGFYPLSSDTVINGIRSNKELEEKVSAALTKNHDNVDYKRKFIALISLINEKYNSLKRENEYIHFNILDDIATEAYKLEFETDYYGEENKYDSLKRR